MNTEAIGNRAITGSFENQSPSVISGVTKRTWKRGIAAILQGAVASQPMQCASKRACRKEADGCTSGAPRGNPKKAIRARYACVQEVRIPVLPDDNTLHSLVSNDVPKVRDSTDYLLGYIQRNGSYEIKKANAISIMAIAMTSWGCNVSEAAERAAECTGFNKETIRKWSSTFFLNENRSQSEDLTDEALTQELSSERGHSSTHLNSLIHNEEFKLEARAFVRKHACHKGEPNLTRAKFAKWVNEQYGVELPDETARIWLSKLGFTRLHHQKGVYFDGHDREDVVQYRKEFLRTLDQLDKKSLTVYGDTPQLDEGEKPLIRVVHDESTYYANSDQSYFWGDNETNVLKQKSLGASIMVSDFVDEVSGYVQDSNGTARVLLETQKDGYFNNDNLLQQVEETIDIFERIHPDAQGLFLFDNAPSHRKVADDALNADRMNVGPGGKQPKMRDTIFDGHVQTLVDDNGIAKGMKTVLQERGVDTDGMKACDLREKLKTYPDFNCQKTILEDYVEGRGHTCLYYPKFHCELSPIERVWCHSKKHTRAYANGTITKLRKLVPEGLDSVTTHMIQKFFRTCREYEKAYRTGRTGREVEETVKQYKSHRRVLDCDS